MTLLQIVSKLDPGDCTRDVLDSTRFLTLNGHKVVVVSGENKPRPSVEGRGKTSSRRDAEDSLVREIDGLGARYYPISLSSNILSIPIAIFRLSQIILKEDIQIVHARDGVSSFVAFFALRFTPPLHPKSGVKNRTFITTIYSPYKKGLFVRSLMWAKRVICFNENQERYLVKKGLVSQGKVCVVPPFIEGDRCFSVNYSHKSTCPLRGTKHEGFAVGAALPLSSFEVVQNFIKTVLILSRTISNIKVFVIDSAARYEKDSVERLKLLAKRYFLDNVVTVLSQEESPRVLNRLDLYVDYPAPHTHVGVDENLATRLLLKSALHGIPVVTTNFDWIKNYAPDGKRPFLVCRNNTPKDLSDSIIGLHRDENLKNELIDEARKLIREKFNIRTVMESTLKVYEDALLTSNILIIKIGALGDVILAAPSIRAIRARFPRAKIKLLTGIKNREVFMNSPLIDEIIVCDFRERDRRLAEFLRVLKILRQNDFDMVIDLQNNKISHLLSFLSGSTQRYGYDNGKLSFLLNRKVRDTKVPMDPIEHQSKVLGLLGIYDIDNKLELWPSKEDEEWADNFLKSHWVSSPLLQPFSEKDAFTPPLYRGAGFTDTNGMGYTKPVAFNIGASPKWITKLWPVEYYAEVCNKLAKNFGIRILLIGIGRGNPRIAEFLKRAKCKPINALNKTNIPRLASLLKRCSLLVSPDSAPIHVAASVGIPFVALFGPTDPKRHLAPVKGNYKIFKKDIECSPCYRSRCDIGYVCMRSIKPDEAYEAILELLNIKNAKT